MLITTMPLLALDFWMYMACAYIIHIGIKMHDELLKLQKDTLVLSLAAANTLFMT